MATIYIYQSPLTLDTPRSLQLSSAPNKNSATRESQLIPQIKTLFWPTV